MTTVSGMGSTQVRVDGRSGVFRQILVVALLALTLFPGDPEAATSLVNRVAIADLVQVVLLLLVFFRFLFLGVGDSRIWLRYLSIPVGVLILVSIISVIATGSAIDNYLVFLFAVSYLIVPLVLLSSPKMLPSYRVLEYGCYAVISLFVLLTLPAVIFGEIVSRNSALGSFSNPNHASAWASCSIIFLVSVSRLTWFKVILIGSCTVILLVSYSFSSVIALGTAVLFVILVSGKSLARWALGFGLVTFLIATWFVASDFLATIAPRLAQADSFEKSAEGRSLIWENALQGFYQNPMFGGGDLAIRTWVGRDIHNDYLTFMVLFGFIGLLILAMFAIALWRLGGMTTRALLVFIAINALGHTTFSWRYLWVFLAIALVLDYKLKEKAISDSSNSELQLAQS